MKKVYVVGNNIAYGQWITNSELVDNIEEADIVVFTGGEDVDPSLYGHEKFELTFSNIKRDLEEQKEFNKIRKDQLAVGVCRGSQFLCVMNGGKLVQHCENHGMRHTHGITNGNLVYEITSTHHQMQYPFNLKNDEYKILFYAHPSRSYDYYGQGISSSVVRDTEPEVVKYTVKDKPVCLAIQGHPEYMRKESPVVIMLNNLINETLATIKK